MLVTNLKIINALSPNLGIIEKCLRQNFIGDKSDNTTKNNS